MPSPIPARLPTVTADRMLATWQDLGVGEMVIPVEMVFDRSLDADRLGRAFALALDAEPVAGCRFVRERGTSWERLADPAGGAFTVSADAAAYGRFVAGTLDMFGGPQSRAFLLQASSGDRLCVHVSHAIADAGGTKHFVGTLSSIYRRLGTEPSHVPAPNLTGPRGVDQLFRALPLRAHWRALVNFYREMRRLLLPRRTHRFEPPTGPRAPTVFVVRHVAAERVARLAGYGRARGATLNDLLMAAFVRAQLAVGPWDGRSQVRLQTTVDLRRYLPGRRAGGVCNLSAFDYFFPGTDPGHDFVATLERIVATTRRRKADFTGLTMIGLAPLIAALPYRALRAVFRRMFRDGIEDHNQPNALTNMGPIAAGDVDFGGAPTAAWLLTPPIHPPLFGIGVTGYAGALTLSAGTPAHAAPPIEDLFDRLIAELPEG
ncbi:MAG: hypothetical protein HY906_13620 [Deltaproteobacteria bacterium]|nr:hypothetical protein [Deltaproteobacteria bacterium]